MGHKESVHRSGTCLTPGCKQSRDSGTWYCKGCNEAFRQEQDKRRGSVGTYPAGKEKPEITIYRPDEGRGPMTAEERQRWGFTNGARRDETLDPWPADRGIEWGSQAKSQGKGDNRPSCEVPGKGHDGRTPFTTLAGGKILYGARGSNLAHANLEHLDLIIDCAGVVAESGRFVKSAPARYRGLKAGLLPDVIRLDWPDMSAPVHVGIRWWMRLLELLPAHTCVCCVGGHGRTGTALASLLVASGMDSETAIRTVREGHCRRAIETTGQEAYIRGLAKAKAAIDHETAIAVTVAKAEKVGGGAA